MGDRADRLAAKLQAGKQASEAREHALKARTAERKAAGVPQPPMTPEELARAAHEAGEGFFEIQMDVGYSQRRIPTWTQFENHKVSETAVPHGGTLAAIEDVGWRLQHVGHVFAVTGENSRDRVWGTGQETAVSGKTIGIYLFRRVD